MAITAAQLEVRVGADTSAAERALSGMGTKVQGMGKSMAGVGMAMTAGITAPIVAGFAAAVSSAADFEQSLNVLAAVTDAPAEAMQMLTDQALELGASTVFSANEAAEAMLELGKAGMSTAEIGEAIGGVMDLAAAGGMELADAAGITSAALQTFGLDASESAYVANSLAAAANASSASMQDLGYGIRNAGSVMAASGVDIDTLNTLMAILTNHGLEASDAATSLKTMHMRLTAPTAKAAKVMQRLGINVFDSAGNMRDYRDIIGDMTAATEGMSDEMQSMAFETVFGADAIRAANIVVQEGVEGYDDMTRAVKEEGAAQRAAAAQTQGFSGAMERLGGSIDTLTKRVILPWMDSLTGVVDMVGGVIDSISNISPELMNMALGFAAVAAAAGPLLLIIGSLVSAFTLTNLIILAVVAAVAALAAAWATDFMGMKSAAQSAWDTVSGFFNDIATAPQTVAALQTVSNFFTSIVTQAGEMAGAVKRAFDNTTFPTMAELWADFKAGDWGALVEKIQTTVTKLMVNLDHELHITATAKELGQKLIDAVEGVAGAISKVDWQAKASEITTHMTTLRDTVYQSLTTAITAVPWTTVGTTIETKINELTAAIKDINLDDINWKTTLETILLGPIKLAIEGLKWVFGGSSFKTFQEAVIKAVEDLSWLDIAAALEGLGTAVYDQLVKIAKDIAADFGLNLNAEQYVTQADVEFMGALNEHKPDFSGVAINWRNLFGAELLINSPAFEYISGLWGTLFGNKLSADETVDFPAVAKLWGDLLKGDLLATAMDFGPAAIQIKGAIEKAVTDINWKPLSVDFANFIIEVGLEMEAQDWTGTGRTLGTIIKNVFVIALGSLLLTVLSPLVFTFVGELLGTMLGDATTEAKAIDWGVVAWTLFTGLQESLLETLSGMFLAWGIDLGEINITIEGWLENAGIWAAEVKTTFDGWITTATGWVNTADTQLTAWLTRADEWVKMANTQLTAWLTEATGWVTFVKTNLDGWLTNAGIWVAVAALAFGLWLAGVQTWATDLYTKLSEWLTGVQQWGTDVNTTLDDWATAADAWIALVSQAFQAFVDQAGKWITSVGTTLMDWHNHAMAWILNVGATLKSWMDRAIKWVADLFATPDWVITLTTWTPAWLDRLFGWSPTIKVDDQTDDEPPAAASGTPYAKGGMTWVGEHGPELVNLPRGSRVWSNTQSMAMAAAGATVSIGAVHIHNDMDVEVLAATIARRIAQGGRR